MATWADLEKTNLLADHEREKEYRRGYCDGWIQATNAITDLRTIRNRALIENALYDHWEVLTEWMLGDCSKIIVPPNTSTICHYCHINGATEMDHVIPGSGVRG